MWARVGLCVHGMMWAGRSGAVSARQFFMDFLSRCGIFHLLFGGRGRIDLGECALVFVLAHGDFLECTEGGLLCARES